MPDRIPGAWDISIEKLKIPTLTYVHFNVCGDV